MSDGVWCCGAAAQIRSQKIIRPESGSLTGAEWGFLGAGQSATIRKDATPQRDGAPHRDATRSRHPRTARFPAASYPSCRRGEWLRELRHAFSKLAAGKRNPPQPMDQVSVEGAMLPAVPGIAAGVGVWVAIEVRAETWTETETETETEIGVVIPVAAGCRQLLPACRRTPSPDNSLRRRTSHSARENLPA